MKIDVTPEDITEGLPGDALYCALALAIRRIMGKRRKCRVDSDSVKLGRHRVLLPLNAFRFRCRFDRGWLVQPFSFELEL